MDDGRRKRLIAVDTLAAAIGTVLLVALALDRHPSWPWALLAAAAGLPIAVVRIRPLPIFLTVLAASLGWALLDPVRAPFVATAYAMFHLSAVTPRPRWIRTTTAAVLSLGTLGLLTVTGTPAGRPGWWSTRPQLLVLAAVVLAVVWTIGQVVRDRRIAAARAAGQVTDRAVTEERLRIARELHDSVAHSMGVIAVKAAVARHVARERPGEAQDALRVIEATSKGALAEMRHLLGVLRSTGEPAPTVPPGMAALPALTRQVTAAGVVVDLAVGDVDRLPATMELPVFRIVQESLTNVAKHAAPTRCRVTVTAEPDRVRIEIRDDGRPGSPGPGPGPPGGHGLIGMRERVAAYGGTFTAGSRPDGGFRVSAMIPYDVGTGAPT